MKQARKDERRQARHNKPSVNDAGDHEAYLRELGFDPEIMAAQR